MATKTKRSAKKGRPGFNMGARQIDCEEYMPEPGDWEETNVLFDFGDGWLICEDRTTYDRKLMAKLTKTCIGTPSYINACFPVMSEDEWWAFKRSELIRFNSEKAWKQRHSREGLEAMVEKYGPNTYAGQDAAARLKTLGDSDPTYDEFIDGLLAQEKRLANGGTRGYGPPQPLYRMGHVRDPEGRPRAAILFVRADAISGCPGYNPKLAANYANSNDLGQDGFFNIEGVDFRMVEVRLGTGRTGPREALERCAIFYQEVVGKWDQEAFEKVRGAQYLGVNVNEDLSKYRRK